MERIPTDLPIEAAAADISEAIRRGSLVLTAEPGAGKSSVVPLLAAAVVEASAETTDATPVGRVLVLEPRRLAARATAQRLNGLLAGPRRSLGETVGLTMRGEHRVSNATRIEVMTEAVLTNRLQRDPELPHVAAIVFDEFHERNLHSDLGLAMALEARSTIRPDLKIVVMSATLDTGPVAALLGSDDVIAVPGRTHPVETLHLSRPTGARWADAVAETALRAVAEVEGDVLVFVPGRREIDDVTRRVEQALRSGRSSPTSQSDGAAPGPIDVLGLHGGSDATVQHQALDESARRRIIVATSVAETSVTLPGIEAVVDGGLLRRAKFDPTTGLGRLETVNVTRFSADQRRGRAGRLRPGVCFRLWSVEDHRHLDDAVPPEIVDGDPLPVTFELARWGDADATSLSLLDHPGPDRLVAGRRLLTQLELIGDDGSLSERGRTAGRLGVHPRVGAMLMTAAEATSDHRGLLDAAAMAAAVLDGDRWPTSTDLAAEVDRRWSELRRPAERLARRLEPGRATGQRGGKKGRDSLSRAGLAELPTLLAMAWPDRIALRRENRPGHFLLATGREASVRDSDPLAGAEFLVVAEGDGEARTATIRRAVAVDRATVLSAAAENIEWVEQVAWDERTDAITSERQQRLGAIVLHRAPLPDPAIDLIQAALRVGLRRRGLDLLRWSEKALAIRHRLTWLHGVDDESGRWPAMDDESLLERLDEWLDLSRCRTAADVRRLGVGSSLLNLLGWEERAGFDELAPETLATVGGRQGRLDYSSGRPVLSIRLQHLFGMDRHPTVGPTDAPVTIELLSPANRPAQVTTDLPGFWRGSYAAVRADLRGRYPKHRWPERPWEESG